MFKSLSSRLKDIIVGRLVQQEEKCDHKQLATNISPGEELSVLHSYL